MSQAGLRFVALTYLTTLGASVYPRDEVAGWLRETGSTDVDATGVGPLSAMGFLQARAAE